MNNEWGLMALCQKPFASATPHYGMSFACSIIQTIRQMHVIILVCALLKWKKYRYTKSKVHSWIGEKKMFHYFHYSHNAY